MSPRDARGELTTNPMLVVMGRGPRATTCARCVHLWQVDGRDAYRCDLRRGNGDHKRSWPACHKYEERR